MKIRAMVMAATLVAATAGGACAEWVKVKETPSQSHYLDTASRLETAPGVYRAWGKTVFGNNPAVTEKQAYEEYNCAAGTVKTLSVMVTVKSGSLVTQTPETVEKVLPGTPAQAKQFILCEGGKLPPEGK